MVAPPTLNPVVMLVTLPLTVEAVAGDPIDTFSTVFPLTVNGPTVVAAKADVELDTVMK
jgi:hypothetical protein